MIDVTTEWKFRASDITDAQWMAELRAEVMRPDLERLDRYDAIRVRQRFLDAFVPAHTRVIQLDTTDIGLVAVRPENDALWIEHFYLAPSQQGRGIGGEILAHIMMEDASAKPFRLNVLQGSPARRLYERHGFVLGHEDPIDVYLTAPPHGGAP
ncbi:GNAT family N-acetyltransferase [Pseudarthrobacter sp. C4D7]|uniref:GNAT family N-acetyltransferase n=1 Tax=Pseudarthrobacter sp. C4D7 TaxID=2735268 RepID=UPI001585AA12|nr:GNAT family N-acetyltransferase [Pseudarthrobacter sp. C4D7]NUT73344.1 GNAT family N-acetyltransferase [Pseudarthrobacter sp. C4D7]